MSSGENKVRPNGNFIEISEIKSEPSDIMEPRNILIKLIRNGTNWRIARDEEYNRLFPLEVNLRETKPWFENEFDDRVSSILPSGVFHRDECEDLEISAGISPSTHIIKCDRDDSGTFDFVESEITIPVKLKKRVKKYQCDLCGKVLCDLKGYNRHVNVTHSKIRSHKCNKCSKAYKCKDELNKHKKTHDPGFQKRLKREIRLQTFKCEVCGKLLRNKHCLIQHQMTHSDHRPYKCDNCDSKFKRKYDLLNHSRVHSDAKPFPCSKCNRVFKYRKTLIKHNQISHSIVRKVMQTLCPKKPRQRRSMRKRSKPSQTISDSSENWDDPVSDNSKNWDDPVSDNSKSWDDPVSDNSKSWDDRVSDNSKSWDDRVSDNSDHWDDPVSDNSKSWDDRVSDNSKSWDDPVSDNSDHWDDRVSDNSDHWDDRVSDNSDHWDDRVSDNSDLISDNRPILYNYEHHNFDKIKFSRYCVVKLNRLTEKELSLFGINVMNTIPDFKYEI